VGHTELHEAEEGGSTISCKVDSLLAGAEVHRLVQVEVTGEEGCQLGRLAKVGWLMEGHQRLRVYLRRRYRFRRPRLADRS
jgi:hypothetical protein